MRYRFSELVDIHSVRSLLSRFHRITGTGCALYEVDGTKLATSGWAPICIHFHRRDPRTRQRCIESDTILARSLLDGGKHAIYKCMNGLIDTVAPVIVEGELVANVFSGQVLFEEPDLAWFREQAREFGFDESRYLDAVRAVPVLNREKLEPIIEYLSEFAQFLGELGLARMRQLAAEEAMQATQNRLKTLSRTLLRRMEVERHYVAYELHDEIGQALTVVKMSLEAMQTLPDSSEMDRHLSESIAVIDKALEQVRDLSLNLRPAVLDDLGLVAALRWLVNSMTRKSGLEILFDADEIEPRLTKEIETACFRVAQEAITNVLRHARASAITINLEKDADHLQLAVCDDGVGFDVRSAQARSASGGSFGLLGMEERVSLSGGSFEVESSLGGGSKVKAHFSLKVGRNGTDSRPNR